MSIRVLIVEDHDGFRTGLGSILENEGFEVTGVPNGDAALRRVSAFQPHVIVMDVHMPGMSGIEATRRVLHLAPGTAVVILSMFQDDELVAAALQAGASRYLRKDARFDEIVSAIRAAADGASTLDAGVAGAPIGCRPRGPALLL